MVGSRVVAEAVARGHQVTAVSRSGQTPEAAGPGTVTALAADATDASVATEIAANHDAVVSAIGPSREPGGDAAAFADTLAALAAAVRDSRLLVVGGAGSLLVAPGVRLLDVPEFPAEYLTEARAAADSLDRLRTLDAEGRLGRWTYLSPAPVIAPGTRTGSYQVADDNPAGDSISAEDFAVAILDELEKPAHDGARFTVAT